MLKVIELAFCCYAVTDMTRARAFYEGVLGLNPTTVNSSEHGQWTEYEFGPYALAIGAAPATAVQQDRSSATRADNLVGWRYGECDEQGGARTISCPDATGAGSY